MTYLMNHPLLVFALAFVVLLLSELIGVFLLRKQGGLEESAREQFGVIQTAALTLLGLIIGFSFSMAISRYDQRKNYEEAEANAIGTEYVRADLLQPAGRLWCATGSRGDHPDGGTAARRVHLVLSHRGHRQPARRRHPRAAAKPGKPLSIPRSGVGTAR